MEWIILVLCGLCALISLFTLLQLKKGQNNNGQELYLSQLRETFAQNTTSFIKELGEFSHKISNHQRDEFEKVRATLETRLDKIDKRVQDNLNEGFKKTHQTFNNVIERLAKIDEAQKKIENLSSEVVSLQDVLMDKKTRGIFGEVQLNQILNSVFGEGMDRVAKIQATLSNGKIVDALLDLPEPMGLIPVDSKFPLENYKKMVDRSLGESERKIATRDFKANIKKHIDDIAGKYLTPEETSDQAVMFIPAEAIFAEIHAYHPDLIEYSQNQKVWMASPTTFMATLTTIQSILVNVERNKYMNIMHEEINKLGLEFGRYQDRWNDLSKHINTVTKDVEKIHITSDKISKRFQDIMAVDLQEKDLPEETGPKTLL